MQNVNLFFFFIHFFSFFYLYNHDSINVMKMQTYFKNFISIVSITMALGMGVQIANADTRTGNLSIYLLIDKSLSMKQEISSVNYYLEQTVVNNLLQTDDF